jgi:hypothetical protein
VVLGGDRRVGPPRSVEHAYELREAIRRRDVVLELGGWANPYADPASQASFLADRAFNAGFYLTQIVTHHSPRPVERFLAECRRRGVGLPGIFGVFFFRSANHRTLETLSRFLPVPAEGLTREFSSGLSAAEVCARTLSRMADIGVRHFYISNLPLAGTQELLSEVVDRAGLR